MVPERNDRESYYEMEKQKHVLAVRKGQKVYVEGIVGPTVEGVATLRELDNWLYAVVFEEDAIICVEGFLEMTVRNLRFARKNLSKVERSMYKGVRILHSSVKNHGVRRPLLAALLQAGEKPKYVPGGAQWSVAFCDNQDGEGGEIIVPAPTSDTEYYCDGAIPNFFVVKASDIKNILATLSSQDPRDVLLKNSRLVSAYV